MASSYIPRLLDPLLDEVLRQAPAVMVLGPRACGKTTTAGRRAETVVRLDVEAEAAAFRSDPAAALAGLSEPVLLDEWQEVPGVFGAARRAVDADPRESRFLLTGSALAAQEQETWPGTGRFLRLTMFPMSVRERVGEVTRKSFLDKVADGDVLTVPADTPDLRGYLDLALQSGFPAASLRLDGRAQRIWLRSYLDDLLTHDVVELDDPTTRRRDPERLRRYFEAYALNSAGVTEHKTLFDAAGVDKRTANVYEELLTRLFVVEQVPAWATNRLKRLVRTPKRFIVDAALIAAALRIDAAGILADGDLLGRMIETFVVAQLRPEAVVARSEPRLYHLRTEQGRHEVDLIIELGGGRVVGLEVKASAAPGGDDARHLRWLRQELGDRFVAGVVLHTGPRAFLLDDRITAAPISAIWG